jgi:hypothetical protein
MKLVMLIAHHYQKTSGMQYCPTFELDNAKCKSSCLLGNTTETQDADICKLFAGIVDECII